MSRIVVAGNHPRYAKGRSRSHWAHQPIGMAAKRKDDVNAPVSWWLEPRDFYGRAKGEQARMSASRLAAALNPTYFD